MNRFIALAFAVAFFAVASHAAFTARFILAGGIKNSGRMTGTMEYSYETKNYAFKFESNSFKEHYTFQADGGTGGNFTDQFLYETGANSICGKCQRLALNAEIPRFTSQQGSGWSSSGSVTVGTRSCTEYTYSGANSGPYQPKKVAISGDDQPCRLEYVSGRSFTFEPAVAATTLDFSVPVDCQCHKRLDIILAVDSSCSIDTATQWPKINEFIRKLVAEFTYGPDAAALSLAGYWGQAKLMIPLLDDGSKLQTLTATDFARPNGPECGTDVLKGFEVHRTQTFPLLRQGATPVVITVTDGKDRSGGPAITNYIDTNFRVAPYNIKNYISIYVGKQNLADTLDQMVALAGGDRSRTFEYADYPAFVKAASEIQSVACAADTVNGGCGDGCCGMCMCGTCVSPNDCNDGLECTAQALKPTATAGLSCCEAPVAKTCTPTNACKNSVCMEPSGQCTESDVTCTPHPNTTCFTTSCDPAFGCQSIDRCNTTNCDDGNACTLDEVDTSSSTFCKHTLIPCNPTNKCFTAKCNPKATSGNACVQTPINATEICNDFNACTDDLCDAQIGNAATGCVNTPRPPCSDGQPCTDDSCDPLRGCVTNIKDCGTRGKCEVGVCVNGSCTYQKPVLCKNEILAVGLSAAAIAGIVIGVVVAAALGAFGIFKGVEAYNASKDLDDSGMNNPLYEQGGNYGQSGIYVAAK